MNEKSETQIKSESIPPVDDISSKVGEAHKLASKLHSEGKMTHEEFDQLDDALILRERKNMIEGV